MHKTKNEKTKKEKRKTIKRGFCPLENAGKRLKLVRVFCMKGNLTDGKPLSQLSPTSCMTTLSSMALIDRAKATDSKLGFEMLTVRV